MFALKKQVTSDCYKFLTLLKNRRLTDFELIKLKISRCLWHCTRYHLKQSRSCARCLSSHVPRKKGQLEPIKEDIPIENIRNFSIIAHVDHGKSTLADRLLEITGVIAANSGEHQVLDRLQVERERGITVKAQTASLSYVIDGKEYLLNLVDTPGHVDFSNEVSRSLAACQGVILLVDSKQGVQAQTVANFYLAFMKNLVIIPVLNKIDLKNACPDEVIEQLKTLFDIEKKDVLKVSAKLGTGVEDVLQAVVQRIPPPNVDRTKPFRALLFDSWYDCYRGNIILLYVTDGSLKVGDEIVSVYTKKSYIVRNLGFVRPHEESSKQIMAGQIGYVVCKMLSPKEAHIGDTFHLKQSPVEALPGFSPIRPMVYAGIYPIDQTKHTELQKAIEKLALNDSAVTFSLETSPALGHGWRLGFLGLLHMEVFSQRLEQEYGAETVVTAPSVPYKVKIIGKKNIEAYGSDIITISNPADFPDSCIVSEYQEPMALATIVTPEPYYGAIMGFCMERRGVQQSCTNIDSNRMMLQFVFPLNEIIVDFHDHLKSMSSGYASFDYEDYGYAPSKLVKITILLNKKPVEELSTIAHISRANKIARQMALKLVDTIPRQMFHIAIQAVVGSHVLARENLKPYRKDVTAKLYGGDVTRRMKLLHQQAEGKKKMKMIGNIQIPRETFINVLKQ